ncbi:MAG: phage Gp37/Gp68 family protein [Candidatus Altiarchaeota archaeon]|nr:phage Gp37/Gp68 family protein [Candidatus Altiarchaeota archaeon]
MSDNSHIEWTEATWNPCTGCTKISTGCQNCYAERLAIRLKKMGQKKYRNGFKLTVHEDVLEIPEKWVKPRKIFVNSMSDLFHKDVPTSFVFKVFDVMQKTDRHQYQVLTKRPERTVELNNKLPWSPNIWMGVTVENNDYVHRIDYLRKTSAAVKFISFEPLLGPIRDADLQGIDWVIVGGESGPNSRPMEKQWVTSLRDQCKRDGIPFFFKQWGGFNKKANGRLLEGRTYDGYPNQPETKSTLFMPEYNQIIASACRLQEH